MVTIPSFYHYDNTLVKQLAGIQCQMNYNIPMGALAALNTFQGQLPFSANVSMPTCIQTLNLLNSVQSTCKIPQIETIVQNAQRIYDVWTPAMQSVFNQQYQVQEMIPRFESAMHSVISSSYAGLTKDVKVSSLATILGAFAGIEILDHDFPVDTSCLTEEESAQLSSELSEAVEDRQNWQQRLMEILQRWKSRNPVVAGIAQMLITAIISQLISSLLQWGATTLKDSIIREEPSSKATVICQVKKGENITVVGDAPYYYLVEFENPEKGECLSGYISKKSVKPAQSDGN